MKVIVNNFFDGILKRGIPIYTSELVQKLRDNNVQVIYVACPKAFHKLPSWFLNVLFIIVEQLLIPIMGIFYRTKYNIYPYNSSSIIDLLLGKAIVIIHDFISLKKNKRNLAAIYVKVCIYFSSFLAKKVIFISQSTQRVSKRISLFKCIESILLPNPFFSFEKIANVTEIKDLGYLLLVSGLGDNKDLGTALDYYFSIPREERIPLKILGCGNGISKVNDLIDGRDTDKEIEIIGFVSLEEVVKLYCNSKIVWAHSLAEGYGRTLAEAKLTCKNVICTRISAFREQKDSNIFFYTYYSEYYEVYSYLVDNSPSVERKVLHEHILFENELRKIYE